MSVFDQGARTRRVLTHSKDRTAKILDGFPNDAEGKNGDIQYRRIATGIVMFIKDQDKWTNLTTSKEALSDATITAQEFGATYSGGGASSSSSGINQYLTSQTITVGGEHPMQGSGATSLEVNGDATYFDATKMETGQASTGLLIFTSATKVGSALTDIDTILGKLAPPKPPNLSDVTGTLSIGTTYTAKEQGTNTSRSPVTEDATPKFIIAPNNAPVTGLDGFFDGSAGTIQGYFAQDGSTFIGSGSIDITAEGSSTENGADEGESVTANGVTTEITNDFDPWFGTEGKANFWEALDVEVSFATLQPGDTSTIGMKFQAIHSTTGTCVSDQFYFDQATNPTISSITDSNLTGMPSEPGDVRERHGVLAFDGGGSFTMEYQVSGVCDKFYHNTSIGQSKIEGWNNSYVNDNAASAPTEGASPTLTRARTKSGTPHSGKASFAANNFKLHGLSRNFKGLTATTSYQLTDVYVDAYSDKSNRRNAGNTQYPAYGTNSQTQYGGSAFSMQVLLGTANFYELMQFGNYIQWPNKDFSWINHPTQDETDIDYNTDIASSDGTNIGGSYYRWFCKKFSGVLSSSSGFTIEISGDSGFSGSPHDSNIKVYAIVVSGGTELTTWMDCNTSPGFQPGDPNPGTVADGDLCVLDASSNKDTKVCTFGTATYTGDLYVRIGLKDNTDKFQDISISGT